MQIVINSDNHIDVSAEQARQWESKVADSLQRFSGWITRVEIHLTDENSRAKGGGDDIRCLMEARPAEHQPISIEVRAADPKLAIAEGAKTLKKRLGTMVDKMIDKNQSRNQ